MITPDLNDKLQSIMTRADMMKNLAEAFGRVPLSLFHRSFSDSIQKKDTLEMNGDIYQQSSFSLVKYNCFQR